MKNDNITIIARMRGLPSQSGTPETENDPCNPTVRAELKEQPLLDALVIIASYADAPCSKGHRSTVKTLVQAAQEALAKYSALTAGQHSEK